MDAFAQLRVYDSFQAFFQSNPDRLYRFWVYKHVFTPLEMEKKYIDQGEYESSHAQIGVIREVIPLPGNDMLLGIAVIYENISELQDESHTLAYYRLSEIRLNYVPMDGENYAEEN